MKNATKKYFWNILIVLDQFLNVLLAGDPDETVSSRLGKAQKAGRVPNWLNWLVWSLDKLDPQHCIESIEKDEGDDASWKK